MEKNNKNCSYKKPCLFKDSKEIENKCIDCVWNKESKEENRYDWPRRLIIAGLF